MCSMRIGVGARWSRPPPPPPISPPRPRLRRRSSAGAAATASHRLPAATTASSFEAAAAAFGGLLTAATTCPSAANLAALRSALATHPSLARAPLSGGGANGGVTPLAEAANVHAGAPAVVQALLDAGAPVDGVLRPGGKTPLYIAAGRACAEVVTLLLAAGANVNVKPTKATTPLLLAAEMAPPAVVAALLAARPPPDLTAVNDMGNPPLVLALLNVAAVIPLLVAAGADVNTRLRGGWSVLMTAAHRGCAAHVTALLDAHAAVNVVADDGWTALLLAASVHSWAAVASLLRAGADAAAAGGPNLLTALHTAAKANHVPTLQALVAALASIDAVCCSSRAGTTTTMGAAGVDARCEDGSTPLMMAALAGSEAAVATLLDAGAAVDAPPRADGNNALHLGVISVHKRVVNLLLDRGASVDARTTAGFTPLHLATEQLSLPLVRALLAAGANVDSTTPEGDTALHLAAYWGGEALVRELLSWGANPGAENNAGSTPAGEAATEGHVALERLLVTEAMGWTPERAAASAAATKAAASTTPASNHVVGLRTATDVDTCSLTPPGPNRSRAGESSRVALTCEATAAAALSEAASDGDDEEPVVTAAGVDMLLTGPHRQTTLSLKDAAAAWALIDRDAPPPPRETSPLPPPTPPLSTFPPPTPSPRTRADVVDAHRDAAADVTPPSPTEQSTAAETPAPTERGDDMAGGGDTVSGRLAQAAMAGTVVAAAAAAPALQGVPSAAARPALALERADATPLAAAGTVAGAETSPAVLLAPSVVPPNPSPTTSAGATTTLAGVGRSSLVPNLQSPPSPVGSLLRYCAAPTADGALSMTVQEDTPFRLADEPPLSLAPAEKSPAAVDGGEAAIVDSSSAAAGRLSVRNRRPRARDGTGEPACPPPSTRPTKIPRLSDEAVATPPRRVGVATHPSDAAVSSSSPASKTAAGVTSTRSLSTTTRLQDQPCDPPDVIVLDSDDNDTSPLPTSQAANAQAAPRRFPPHGLAAPHSFRSARRVAGPAGATNSAHLCPCPACKKLSPARFATELAAKLSPGHDPLVLASLRKAITDVAEKEMISGAAAVAAEDPERLAYQLLSSFRRRRDGGPPAGVRTLANAYLGDINARQRILGKPGALPVCASCSVGGGWAGMGVKVELKGSQSQGGGPSAARGWGGRSGGRWRDGRGGGGG
ncbi:hypothetical protein MMPV_005340 [Pyropia vietnamensis]